MLQQIYTFLRKIFIIHDKNTELTQRTQISLRRLQDILKRSRRLKTKPVVLKTSSRDVLFTTSWRRRIYVVLKMSDLRRPEDVWFATFWRCLFYDVLKTSDLQRLEDVAFTSSWRRLIYDVLKTSDLRCPEDVCRTTSV